jgi:hypothetical protein
MTSGDGIVLRGWTLMALGVLAVVLGGLWGLQGLGVVGGSVMSGVAMWAVIGPIVAVAGLVLIAMGVRRRSRTRR